MIQYDITKNRRLNETQDVWQILYFISKSDNFDSIWTVDSTESDFSSLKHRRYEPNRWNFLPNVKL